MNPENTQLPIYIVPPQQPDEEVADMMRKLIGLNIPAEQMRVSLSIAPDALDGLARDDEEESKDV